MRIYSSWRVLSLFIFGMFAAAFSGVAQPSQLLTPSLHSKDATAAWAELSAAQKPPATPEAWKSAPPSKEEKQEFFKPYLKALIGKLADFCTRFPQDSHVMEAEIQEYQMRLVASEWGIPDQQSGIAGLEKSMASAPGLTAMGRQKALPLMQALTNSATPPQEKMQAAMSLSQMRWIGQPLSMKFTAVDGRPVDFSALKGKVVMMDFWATWCGPCVGEVPNVKAAFEKLHPKGFEIVGISLDQDKDKLTQFVSEHQMTWPQYFDGQGWQNKYAQQFDITSIPAMWLIDKKGMISDIEGREDLAAKVEKMLAE